MQGTSKSKETINSVWFWWFLLFKYSVSLHMPWIDGLQIHQRVRALVSRQERSALLVPQCNCVSSTRCIHQSVQIGFFLVFAFWHLVRKLFFWYFWMNDKCSFTWKWFFGGVLYCVRLTWFSLGFQIHKFSLFVYFSFKVVFVRTQNRTQRCALFDHVVKG